MHYNYKLLNSRLTLRNKNTSVKVCEREGEKGKREIIYDTQEKVYKKKENKKKKK